VQWAQVCFIDGLFQNANDPTVFLAKMLQSKSPLLDHFAGLYTYGQPKIGDAEFSKVFSPRMTSKIFHHVYNNDIIPRTPTLWHYE
jgi:predicted lipase